VFPVTGSDNPAVAQAIVIHAESVCEHENHLWDVIHQLGIPTELLTDTRAQHKTDYNTDECVRAFLYAKIHGYSRNKLADILSERTSILKACRFDVKSLSDAPPQQTLNDIWNKFSSDTQRIITAAAVGIAQAAVEHDVITEGLAPILEDDDDEQEEEEDKADVERRQSTRTIKLARNHAFPEFESGRTINRDYEDEQILEMVARMCAYTGSANSEGEYGWLTDDDLTAHGSTILRVLKKFATPDDEVEDLTLDEIMRDDDMPDIDTIRGELMKSFDAALENIITALKGGGPFSDRTKTGAIDITTEQFHVSPWVDKDEGIPKPEYPRMVSGYKNKQHDTIERGYKYATITLAGNLAPIILGVEPVKENSNWEEDDAPSYSKADLVDRLLASAERFVDLDEVFLDRGFHSKGVYAAIEERGITYTAPVPTYEDDYTAIKKIEEHPDADAAVLHDVPVAIDGEVHHYTEYMYVPSESDDADGKYAVFITNRGHVEPELIDVVCDRYRRRWDIENQYKSIKECLPRTASTDYRVRLCNFVLTCLLYNLWRLTDYLIKVGRDKDIRSAPELGFRTFVRALGDFLREFG
jgi:hypothetical protein